MLQRGCGWTVSRVVQGSCHAPLVPRVHARVLPGMLMVRTWPEQDSRTFDGDMTDAGRRELKDLDGQWKKICILGGSKGVGKEVIELLSGCRSLNSAVLCALHPGSCTDRCAHNMAL